MSFDKIIDTAFEAVDEVGPQAFNMRMLAERLESGTATLYRHFASKDEILAYVLDRFLGELKELDTGASDKARVPWQQAMISVATALYKLLGVHPKMVPLMVSQVPLGPNGLKMRESGLSLLLANGFAPDLATRAYVTIGHYVLGFAIQQHAATFWEEKHTRVELGRFFKGLNANTYPSTLKAAQQLSSLSNDDEFHFGLKLIVDGLEQARKSSTKQTAGRKSK